MNPFIDRQNKGTHKHGQKSEYKTAKRLGAKPRPGSGSIAGCKGDILLPDFLIENKSTECKSLSLKQEWLTKIYREAREENRAPAVAIQFVDKQGESVRMGRWVLILEDTFNDFIES